MLELLLVVVDFTDYLIHFLLLLIQLLIELLHLLFDVLDLLLLRQFLFFQPLIVDLKL